MRAKQIGRHGRRTVAQRRGKTGERKAVRSATRRKDEKLTEKQRWQLTQLVVSGSLFVLLVAVTCFLPERAERVHGPLSEAIHRNMDVQAVFSAVGRAFTGAESGGEGIYQAVFGPEEPEQSIKALEPDLENAAAWRILQSNRATKINGADPVSVVTEDSSPETLAYILYSDRNLPENVSMEQAILNFDYCTPLRGSVSSDFGYRDHPTEGSERFHYGVDLAADSGAEICCFADGTVTAVGESSSYGKYCIVSHEKGYRTLYAHCSRVTATSGTAVRGGDKIAEVGETGMATGPHLHFELQREKTYLNPIYYLDPL